MKISKGVIETVAEDLKGLLSTYQADLDQAYLETGDDEALKVSLSVKITPNNDKLKLESGISFTTGKVKDTKTSLFDEKQGKLKFPE